MQPACSRPARYNSRGIFFSFSLAHLRAEELSPSAFFLRAKLDDHALDPIRGLGKAEIIDFLDARRLVELDEAGSLHDEMGTFTHTTFAQGWSR